MTIKIGLTSVAALVLLAGCGTTAPEGFNYVNFQQSPRQLIKVEKRNETHQVAVDRTSGQPSPLEQRRLEAFIKDFAGDRPESLRLSVRGPGTSDQLMRVADILVQMGIDPDSIQLQPGQPGTAQTVTVSAERAIAVAPDCPGWTDHPSSPGDNRVLPNFGCSDVNNLARMVADPNDLVKGKSSTFSDGERGANAVRNYKDDKGKELPKLQDQVGVTGSAK